MLENGVAILANLNRAFDVARRFDGGRQHACDGRNRTIEGKFAQDQLAAKDLPEVMKLHSDYVQSQMRALAEQASEMGQIVGRAAMDAAKPKS